MHGRTALVARYHETAANAEGVRAAGTFDHALGQEGGMKALRDIVGGLAEAPAAAIAEAVAPFLRDIGWLEALTGAAIRAMRCDPLFLPRLRTARTGDQRILSLCESDRFSLALIFSTPGQEPGAQVHFIADHVLLRQVGSGSTMVQLHHLGADGVAHAERGRALEAGEVLSFDGRITAARITGEGAEPQVLLRARIRQIEALLGATHDAASGERIARFATDPLDSRTMMLLSLLRAQGRRDAGDCFAEALAAPHPHQRWSVMREWLALDGKAALPHLERLAQGDPDAAVRAAAAEACATIAARAEQPCRA